jgi:hypothetical protein
MKTRITQKIDNYDIIIGIGEAQIDGVATMPIVEIALKETDEYKSVEAKKQELSIILNMAAQALKNARTAKTQSEKNGYVTEYQQALEKSKSIESELKELIAPLQSKQQELIFKHAVYFTPKQGESIITPEEATVIENAMITATGNNKFLDVNLQEICDNRGKTAWIKKDGKWSKREITKIGDEIKSGEITEVNDEIIAQIESERIAALTPTERNKEKAVIIQGLLAESINMKAGLEIQGDSQALKKSQDWYNAEVSKVELKYGS